MPRIGCKANLWVLTLGSGFESLPEYAVAKHRICNTPVKGKSSREKPNNFKWLWVGLYHCE